MPGIMTPIERPRALVVDKDDERSREMAEFLETELGCETISVRDGEAAYNVLDGDPVHVIVTDLKA